MHNDTIGVYELPKLANPSWSGSVANDEPIELTIDGFKVVKAPSTLTSNKQFLKAVPNFDTFTRIWLVVRDVCLATEQARD